MTGRSALVVGATEARLGGIIEELEALGYDTLFARDVRQAREALETTHFQLLLCADGIEPAELRAASASVAAAEECWYVALRIDETIATPVVRMMADGAGGGLGNRGADARIEGAQAGPWRNALNQFAGEKPTATGGGSGYESLLLFDGAAFARQMDNDRETMTEILTLYIEETERQMQDLQGLIEQKEGAAARKLAHTLKGSFGAVCAARAGTLAREIELAAAESNFVKVSSVFVLLQEAVSGAQAEMEAFLAS